MRKIHLEIFEAVGEHRTMLPSALRESEKPATAVLEWAQELARVDRAPFEVNFQRRTRGHEFYKVKVGTRLFAIIAH